MKYITVEYGGVPAAIVFPDVVLHAHALDLTKLTSAKNPGKILGAGFWRPGDDGEVRTWGESNSLQIRSRREDAEIILSSLACMNTRHGPARPATGLAYPPRRGRGGAALAEPHATS